MLENLKFWNKTTEKELTKEEKREAWLNQEDEPFLMTAKLTKDLAKNIGIVYSCIEIRANTVAKMPIHIFKKIGRNKEKIDNELSYLLNTRPNSFQTPSDFKRLLIANLDINGNCYIKINIKKGKRESLEILENQNVAVVKDKGKIIYKVMEDGKEARLRAEQIIHCRALTLDSDGLKGKSKLEIALDNASNLKASIDLQQKFYQQGTISKDVIMHDSKLEPAAKEVIRKEYIRRNSGIDNAYKPILLDMGLKVSQVGTNFSDAQLVELSKLSKEDICSIFSVPPHMVGNLDRSTYNNIEHQSLEFIINTIQPILINLEEELNYKLLTREEVNGGYYCKFNMESALRGDSKSRAEFYEKMINIGAYSLNDVLEKEDMNTIGEIGDKHRVSLNYVDIEIADKYQLAKAGGGDINE